MKVNADDRHLAQQQGLLFSATTYLNGADPRSPLASPLYGDLYDLPPTLIQVGALETLLGESLDLERALSSAGTNVQLHVYDGMVHEWHLLSALLEAEGGLGDADEAIAEIAAFTSSVCST
jgi:monoterpene epsilon-lactone hydrolase